MTHINDLLDAYWDAAYQEGKEGRTHDTPDGKAQAIRSAIEAALKSDITEQWLGNALFNCIKAAGIIRSDIEKLSVAELLFFSQDLKEMLERRTT